MAERAMDIFSQNLATVSGQAEVDLTAAVSAYNLAFTTTFANLAECMTDLYSEMNG